MIPVIEEMQAVIPISSTFDYREMLSVYNIDEIDHSVIKYYEAVQSWIDGLIRKIESYEQQKEEIIRDFNIIGLKLSKKYEENDNLTSDENTLMELRQRYFQRNLALGMNSVKSKLLAVKRQADDLEDRIDEIDNGTDSIRELALLEQEQRASFAFIAENTAKIVRNALLKIEFFESHHQYVMDAIDIWETWTADYLVFKTTYKELLKGTCEDDGIEENIWSGWYSNWQKLRFAIEQKVQPVVEYGLKRDIETVQPDEEGVVKKLISILKQYKDNVDAFYKEERKSIYQKYAFQSGGELQDKFDT